MVLFYDPADERELDRVVHLLQNNGIEFFLRPEPVKGIGPQQVHVAEEDLARAEELLRGEATLH